MTENEVLNYLVNTKKQIELFGYGHIDNLEIDAIDKAIQAFEEKQERDSPKPLTLEEINNIGYQPIYIATPYGERYGWEIATGVNNGILHLQDGHNGDEWTMDGYGITWIAFLHCPKELKHNEEAWHKALEFTYDRCNKELGGEINDDTYEKDFILDKYEKASNDDLVNMICERFKYGWCQICPLYRNVINGERYDCSLFVEKFPKETRAKTINTLVGLERKEKRHLQNIEIKYAEDDVYDVFVDGRWAFTWSPFENVLDLLNELHKKHEI